MSAFTIEKNVAIPQNTVGRKRKYPFHEMEVGDSFVSDLVSAGASAYNYGKRNDKKFSVHRVSAVGETPEFRIWRRE